MVFGMILLLPVISAPTVKLNATDDGEESIAIRLDPSGFGSNRTFQTKFDISSIPSGKQIDSVEFYSYLYYVSGSGSFDVDIYNIKNQSWSRSFDCSEFASQTKQNNTELIHHHNIGRPFILTLQLSSKCSHLFKYLFIFTIIVLKNITCFFFHSL